MSTPQSTNYIYKFIYNILINPFFLNIIQRNILSFSLKMSRNSLGWVNQEIPKFQTQQDRAPLLMSARPQTHKNLLRRSPSPLSLSLQSFRPPKYRKRFLPFIRPPKSRSCFPSVFSEVGFSCYSW